MTAYLFIYLDYSPAIPNPYTMKMNHREFLGIYIYTKPKNEQQRIFNQDIPNEAEVIRRIRVQSLINEEFGLLGKNKQQVDFLAYFRTMDCRSRNPDTHNLPRLET